MSNIVIRSITPNDHEYLETYVNHNQFTNFTDRWEWYELVQQTYGLTQYWFTAEKQKKTCGLLALTHTQHPLLGNYLATAPFASYGGFYAETEEIQLALLQRATQLRHDLEADYILVRHLDGELDPPAGWVQDSIYATYILELQSNSEQFWTNHLKAKQRNQVRKSLEQGFQTKFGHETALQDFWYVISKSMRELGSPFHSRQYLNRMVKTLKEQLEFVVIYKPGDNEPIGASLLIYDRDRVNHLYANVLRAYRTQCAGDFLYWSVINHSRQHGMRYLEMGRSLIGSGNEHFKMKWRPQRKVLAFWYHLQPGTNLPHLNQANSRFKLAIRIWQQMPPGLCEIIGPHLIWGIL